MSERTVGVLRIPFVGLQVENADQPWSPVKEKGSPANFYPLSSFSSYLWQKNPISVFLT